MTRSSATAVTLPCSVSPLRRIQSLSRRASRAATMDSSYLLLPGGGTSADSFMRSPIRAGGCRDARRTRWRRVPLMRCAVLRDPEPMRARALGVVDRHQLGLRVLEPVVHDDVVVVYPLRQLPGRVLDP